MSLSVSDVRFWRCPVSDHTAVVWEGAIARCEECLMTSVLTDELIGRGQADQRQRDIDRLRFIAQKVAREPNLLITGLPSIPTRSSLRCRAA